jgi:hypothetical protein
MAWPGVVAALVVRETDRVRSQRKPNYTLTIGIVLAVDGPGIWFLNHDKWLGIGCTVLGILGVVPGLFIERRNRRS